MIVERLFYGVVGFLGRRANESTRFQEMDRQFQEFIHAQEEIDEALFLTKSLEYKDLENLLRGLKNGFGIKSILYPGCGSDIYSLEEAFAPEEVFYMDKDPQALIALSTYQN